MTLTYVLLSKQLQMTTAKKLGKNKWRIRSLFRLFGPAMDVLCGWHNIIVRVTTRRYNFERISLAESQAEGWQKLVYTIQPLMQHNAHSMPSVHIALYDSSLWVKFASVVEAELFQRPVQVKLSTPDKVKSLRRALFHIKACSHTCQEGSFITTSTWYS